ncbi:cation:proton antiporter [Conexivisphaera calida]|uniref:Na(+)/H(+) antiporter n=1 Tax=Conexivisphaera calida TaxID=1874277 RepID=A0A4P2VDM1_9ARCH|nr:cation:proton antiporter [Conexivisphaera calida]BBE42709.1 Na(+)/H(+) antiporter [Conexivisphaera calida]
MQIGEIYLALLEISVLLFAAEASRGAVARLGIPAIVGELLMGMALGPYAFGPAINSLLGIRLISLNNYVQLFAQFSVILLIFASGLEQGLSGLRRAGPWGFMGAVFGALLPFLGVTVAFWRGIGPSAALILGAASAATSLAVASAISSEVGFSGHALDFLLTAGAVDDVVSLIILSTAMAASAGSSEPSAVALVAIYYVFAWALISAVSILLLPRMANALGERYAFPFALLSLFGLVAAMVALGFSPIIAAYIAGVALSSSRLSSSFKRLAVGLSSLFGPLFFVIAGAEVDLRASTAYALMMALYITALALALKFAGVLPFAYGATKSRTGSLAASLGMLPRGEMGLAIALAGLSAGIIDGTMYTSVVLMVVLTTLIGSILFSIYVRRHMETVAVGAPPNGDRMELASRGADGRIPPTSSGVTRK